MKSHWISCLTLLLDCENQENTAWIAYYTIHTPWEQISEVRAFKSASSTGHWIAEAYSITRKLW